MNLFPKGEPKGRLAWLLPAAVGGVLLAAYLGLLLWRQGLDPLSFAQLGDGFKQGQPVGQPGYDGQFSYWLAMDPRPAAAGPHFDVPAYRYQRILYPLLARLLALGQPGLIPWTLILVNLAAQVGGTLAVEAWLAEHGVSRWYALTYALWVGLVAGVQLDLTEPLSYALAAAGLLAAHRQRFRLSALCLGLALFAKETALVFLAAAVAWGVLAQSRRPVALYALAAVPFGLFQVQLWQWFGTPGLTSGGWMATPFEWLPYMGLWRIAEVSLPAFVLLATLLVPLAVAPSVWGMVTAAWRVWRGDRALAVLALGANAALIAVLPFSTFREPLAAVRLASGLVLTTVLFGAHARSARVLNYSLFWIAALALLARG